MAPICRTLPDLVVSRSSSRVRFNNSDNCASEFVDVRQVLVKEIPPKINDQLPWLYQFHYQNIQHVLFAPSHPPLPSEISKAYLLGGRHFLVANPFVHRVPFDAEIGRNLIYRKPSIFHSRLPMALVLFS